MARRLLIVLAALSIALRKEKELEAFGYPLDPEAVTIPGLHHDLIQNLRHCMLNDLLDHQTLRLAYRHVAAAQAHLHQAARLTAKCAIGHASQR
jgi:hypothetical protein